MTQGRVVGRGRELLDVDLIATSAIPLMDGRASSGALDPAVGRGELEGREVCVVRQLGNGASELLDWNAVGFGRVLHREGGGHVLLFPGLGVGWLG